MRRPVPALLVSPEQREVLESVPDRLRAVSRVVLAWALLMAADGLAKRCRRVVSLSQASVSGWRARFAEEGLVKFAQSVRPSKDDDPAGEDRRDPGSDTELPPARRNPLELPNHGRGYRCRNHCAAGAVGAGPQTAPGRDVQAVQRSKFEEKPVDVVGLYLNPPEKAIVLCADEKSSVQRSTAPRHRCRWSKAARR